jgi:methyltransferase (TIGR00027 family)
MTTAGTYVALPIDLREDWPTALRSNGFQEQLPTGWSIEGLLPYLPPDAQTALFEHIAALSALGSSLVVDAYRPEFYGEDALRASTPPRWRATS